MIFNREHDDGAAVKRSVSVGVSLSSRTV